MFAYSTTTVEHFDNDKNIKKEYMNRYNNEDISLNESATRSFLEDLFNSNRNDIDRLGFDLIVFSREETKNGITYHFPNFEIDLQNKNLREEFSPIVSPEYTLSSYDSKINLRVIMMKQHHKKKISNHYQKRKEQQIREQIIQTKLNGNGITIKSFIIDNGHERGKEIHTITNHGIVLIQNKRTGMLVTKLISRPSQIKRYYQNIGLDAPEWLLKIARYNKRHGYNR